MDMPRWGVSIENESVTAGEAADRRGSARRRIAGAMTGTATSGEGTTLRLDRSRSDHDHGQTASFGSGRGKSTAVAALSQIAARMRTICEVGRIGGLGTTPDAPHGDAERVVAGGEREGFSASEAHQKNHQKDEESRAGSAA